MSAASVPGREAIALFVHESLRDAPRARRPHESDARAERRWAAQDRGNAAVAAALRRAEEETSVRAGLAFVATGAAWPALTLSEKPYDAAAPVSETMCVDDCEEAAGRAGAFPDKLRLNSLGLAAIPDELGLCRNLAMLQCMCNWLVHLPAALGACSNLRMLSCEGNLLESLPEELGLLPHLVALRCDHNRLRGFPKGLGRCDLQTLTCEGNPLEEPWLGLYAAVVPAGRGPARQDQEAIRRRLKIAAPPS